MSLGGLGLLGTRPAEEAMEQCDAILLVGTSFPYLNYLPNPDKAKGVQIESDPSRMGLRYPIEVGLLGDAKQTLLKLRPLLNYNRNRDFLEDMQDGMKDWWDLMNEHGSRDAVPIKPQVVAHELSSLLDPDAIISTDSGTITTWIAREFKIRANQMFSCSGNLATMAPGLPYTIAAQVAYPDRQCVAFVGDGGFTMLMGEIATAVKYNLPIKVVIIKNNVLGQIKWEQIVFLGNPEYVVELQPIDFAKYAEACGGIGIHVDQPGDIRNALKKMLDADRPCVVEVVTDPFEPPMPAKIKARQAVKFSEALLRGQPEGKRIALTLFRDKVDDLLR
jgi:pyruvate dehydrogenase (quinone)/pyruvate oxidase